MARNTFKPTHVLKAQQPCYTHQQDFRGSSQHEYYPYMPGYSAPQYGYYYCPRHQQPAAEGNVHHPRMYGAQNYGRGGKGHHGAHAIPPTNPAATTPKERPCPIHGHSTDEEGQEDDDLTDKLIRLVDRIHLREEVVLPCLKSEVWKLRDLLTEADSNVEKDAVATAILCVGGAVEVMEDALDFDDELLHELLRPGNAQEGYSCDDHDDDEDRSILNMLQEQIFHTSECYPETKSRKSSTYGHETHATHMTGKSSKKADKADPVVRSGPGPKVKTPKIYNVPSYREF